jgi:adenylylsulfate kinase-like enzyme
LSKSVLWIGGAQWAGKTTVARILWERHSLQLYQYDYHDSRGHAARADARPDLYPQHEPAAPPPGRRARGAAIAGGDGCG